MIEWVHMRVRCAWVVCVLQYLCMCSWILVHTYAVSGVSVRARACTHLHACLQVDKITQELKDLTAGGMHKYVCVHVWTCTCGRMCIKELSAGGIHILPGHEPGTTRCVHAHVHVHNVCVPNCPHAFAHA